MENLDTVQVQGQRTDPLYHIFGTVLSTVGQDPTPERINAGIRAFRSANPGESDQSIVELARSQVPMMIGAVQKTQGPKNIDSSIADQSKYVNDVQNATGVDRQNRQFLGYGASALSKDPVNQQKAFVDAGNETLNAAQGNLDRMKATRTSDQEAQAKEYANQVARNSVTGSNIDLNSKAQGALSASQQMDVNSPETGASKASAAQALKGIGRSDLIPRLEAMNAKQINDFMSGPVAQYLKSTKEMAEVNNVRASAAQGYAGARKTGAEAGLSELTTKAATKGYNDTGSVPSSVEGQVFDAPTLARQKQFDESLGKLTTGSSDRAKTMQTLTGIEDQLRKGVNTGPGLNIKGTKIGIGMFSPYTPEGQKLIKDLAALEISMGVNAGATDLAKQMGVNAAPSIDKYPSVIRAITAKLQSQVQKDNIIQQQMTEASKTGGARNFNEALQRTQMSTLVATGKDGRQIIRTFGPQDIQNGEARKFKELADKNGMTISKI